MPLNEKLYQARIREEKTSECPNPSNHWFWIQSYLSFRIGYQQRLENPVCSTILSLTSGEMNSGFFFNDIFQNEYKSFWLEFQWVQWNKVIFLKKP